jgi:hypothetical protein
MAIFRGIGGAGDSTTDATVTAVTEQAVNAATSATQAASSASSAASSASSASTSATNAAASASTASDAATAAQTAQTNAETAETNAETAQTAAEAAQTAAETAETNAETAETNAETAEANAVIAKNSAEAAQTAAETAETNAETAYANTLAIFGDAQDVQDAVDSASASAATATTKASEASASASNASTSETNSANSASSANTSATNASNSATAASTSASNASTSETNASNSASTATTKASEASASASAALTSETNAATSESNASTSETNAANSASAASTSATNASNSASAASTSETNAASSATAASNSATSASNSATAANNSASAAATSATNAENAYDSFDDRYLGVKASDPALDNDGAALLTGALYFNSTDNEMRVYTGSVWIAVVDLAGDVTVTSLTASSVDINGGAIDGTTIGATTPSTGDFTTLTENDSPAVVQSDIGTDPDEIPLNQYLGSMAYVDADSVNIDGGTIDGVTIGGASAGAITGTTITGTQFSSDATDVELKYSGSTKLATTNTGIDVTGTVTADGLTIEGSAGPLINLYRSDVNALFGAIQFKDTTNTNENARIGWAANELRLQGTNQVSLITDEKTRLFLASTGDISFYEDTGTSQNFYWDASTSRLGLGTTTPATTLDVTGTITADKLLLGASTLRSNFFNTTISPASQFEGVGSSSTSSRFISQTYGNSGAIGPIFTFAKHRSTALGGTTVVVSGDELGQLVFQGSDGTQFVEAASIRAGVDGTPGADDMPGALFFSTTADGGSVATERMRIDSSGNVGIGTTSPSSSLQVDRASTDGAIVTFSKDGATVGFIGTNTGQIYIGRDDTGIRFTSGDDALLPVSANSGVLRSGAIDLGRSYSTFRNLYLSGGVYLGGTGAANLLDDYEEGTFTATLASAGNTGATTLTSNVARYTKIGDVVHIFCTVTGDANLCDAGDHFDIGGLPFASSVYAFSRSPFNGVSHAGNDLLDNRVATGVCSVFENSTKIDVYTNVAAIGSAVGETICTLTVCYTVG